MKEKRSKYHHLSDEERLIAYPMQEKGVPFRKICLALGRPDTAAGSLSREFKRNKPINPLVRQKFDGFDMARFASKKAKERRSLPRKNYKLESDLELKDFVEEKLKEEKASPRDICLRVKRELSGKTISHTTIYDYTKRNRGLIQKLRRKGIPPKQRVTKRKKKKQEVANRRNIRERTSLAESRSEPGHFEVDTVVSPRGGSGYATLSIREMKTRMRWFFLLRDLKAATTLAVLRGFFRMLPAHMIKTLTADNGGENKWLWQLEMVFLGLRVYFCDPYCAYQRGAVENANGELREYFPKGTDFKNVSTQELREVQDKLNRRCMDVLGGRPANEAFQEALDNPPLIQLAGAEVLRSQKALFEATNLRFEQSSDLYLPSQAQLG